MQAKAFLSCHKKGGLNGRLIIVSHKPAGVVMGLT